MDKLKEQSKIDNLLMLSLGVQELSHILYHTNKGALMLKLPKGGSEQDYQLYLDAVPLEEKKNKEVIALIYE